MHADGKEPRRVAHAASQAPAEEPAPPARAAEQPRSPGPSLMQWGDPVSPFAPAVGGARDGKASAQALPMPGQLGSASTGGSGSAAGPATRAARRALLAELHSDVDELQVRPRASTGASSLTPQQSRALSCMLAGCTGCKGMSALPTDSFGHHGVTSLVAAISHSPYLMLLQAALIRERTRRRNAERALRSSLSSRASGEGPSPGPGQGPGPDPDTGSAPSRAGQENRPPARRRARSPLGPYAVAGIPRGTPTSRPRPKKQRSGAATRDDAGKGRRGGEESPDPDGFYPPGSGVDRGLTLQLARTEAALADARALLAHERQLADRHGSLQSSIAPSALWHAVLHMCACKPCSLSSSTRQRTGARPPNSAVQNLCLAAYVCILCPVPCRCQGYLNSTSSSPPHRSRMQSPACPS